MSGLLVCNLGVANPRATVGYETAARELGEFGREVCDGVAHRDHGGLGLGLMHRLGVGMPTARIADLRAGGEYLHELLGDADVVAERFPKRPDLSLGRERLAARIQDRDHR